MKRIGILSGMGAMAMAVLAHGGWPAEIAQGQRGSGKSRATAAVASHHFKNMGRPTAARWWHDLKDGAQLRTMEAAFAKRQRKNAKRAKDLCESVNNNWAHGHGKPGLHPSAVPHFSGRTNPFHVAH